MKTTDLMRWVRGLLLGLVLAATASAYVTYKDSSGVYVVVWPPGTIPMRIKLPAPASTLMDGSSTYATPIISAMQAWNARIGVVQLAGQTDTGTTYSSGNGTNEIVLDSKADGDDFSANTLAITLSYRVGNSRSEADIIFNSAYTWDSYRGSYRSSPQDMQRVALHELGHVLGLLHPDEAEPPQTVSAMMNSTISNLETLTNDDITGAQYLYGAPGAVPANDNFANAATITLSGSSAQVTGATIGGTAQSGEPAHDTETPTHSIWWKWTATSNTPVTLSTLGSNFDTILAVYTGSAINALTTVASNDDVESGVIRTSKLAFNAVAGTTYYFAVDGWDGNYGQVSFGLSLGAESSAPPVITSQPSSFSADAGGSVVLSVTATNTPTSYQWFFNGGPISGATLGTYTLTGLTASHAGNYSVRVGNSAGDVTSDTAVITVNTPAVAMQVVTAGHDVTLTAPFLAANYHWQVSTDGGVTWTNVTEGSGYAGAETPVLTITSVAAGWDNRRYRYTANGYGGTLTGAAITLKVSAALIPFPVAIAADGSGNLYVTDSSTHLVQKINASNQVTTFAGSSGSAGSTNATGTAASFNQPSGISATAGAALTVSDTANATIRRISSAGVVTLIAGSATMRGNGDGAGTDATFRMPIGLAQNSAGTFYIADATNHAIRAMNSSNVVSTFAGSAGNTGSADGSGTAARFNYPTGIAVDGTGSVFVADTTNNLIRKITPAGVVSTLAGVVAVSGWQDGTGSGALFNQPQGLAIDSSGNLYVADTGNSVIRKITPDGTVSTIAGLSTIGGLKDGNGSDAWFNQPRAVAVDSSGDVYVADTGNAAIRKIAPSGAVTTLALTAGTTSGGSSGGGSGGGGGTTTTPSSGSSGGGGGGGGAPSLWFGAVLGAAALWRLLQRHRR